MFDDLQPALDHIIANMDSTVPSADAQASASGNNAAGEDEDDEDDAEALKAHIAKMKAGGDATAGNGEQLAKSVKCSEVRHSSPAHSDIRQLN